MCVKRFIRDLQGAAAIEFAVVFPTFVMLTLGIYWSAWAIHCTHSVRYALAEGARVLQLKPTTTQSELQTFVRNNINVGDGQNTVTVTLSFDPISGARNLLIPLPLIR